MPREPLSFESAITATDFSSEDYCGTTYAAKLLGLSVATVQSLVEKGEIEAWKTLGGHRRLSLRAINGYLQKHSPQLAHADPDPRSRLSVLVVEDDEAARELYKAQFEQWDMTVDCSFMNSALEALMDIASMRPDLLITDLNMPGVDGLEMLRALKRNQQLSAMQILVISGLPEEVVKERGGLPPSAHYLEKPINFDWLHGYITALLVANRKWR
ncbi:response regulator [Polaromonas sp. SM01]|uniref:response regulator n=1 Tax=Polaromonas sp. SM01 TaxID=3085630 RepID=UPI002981A311|nr:response regulator [Polaromonas sp. SM01]MDW5444719.1 response regulator [Polaromonas sp. SM01]